MGYESKLIIVKKSHLDSDPDCNNKVWAEKIAEVRLCVVGDEVCSKITNYPITNSYYYEHLVDNPIIKDMYGYELREIPLIVLQFLKLLIEQTIIGVILLL